MTESIRLDHNAQAILRFHDRSPLRGCSLTGWEGGAQVIKADRFVIQLSEAERMCWNIATSAAKGHVYRPPGLGVFLDGRVLAAVNDLWDAVAGTEATA